MSDIPAQPRRRRTVIAVAVALVLVTGSGAAWWLGRDDDTAKALAYARKACKPFNLGAPAVTAAETDAASEAEGWQKMADNAARAARLDPAWNALARAADAEARVWSLSAQNDPALQGQIDAMVAELNAHPIDPECRKALVN